LKKTPKYFVANRNAQSLSIRPRHIQQIYPLIIQVYLYCCYIDFEALPLSPFFYHPAAAQQTGRDETPNQINKNPRRDTQTCTIIRTLCAKKQLDISHPPIKLSLYLSLLHCAKKKEGNQKDAHSGNRCCWRLFTWRLLRATTSSTKSVTTEIYRQYSTYERDTCNIDCKRPSYIKICFFFYLDEKSTDCCWAHSPSLRRHTWISGGDIHHTGSPPLCIKDRGLTISVRVEPMLVFAPDLKANAARPSQNDIHTHTHRDNVTNGQKKGDPPKQGISFDRIGRLYLMWSMLDRREKERLFFCLLMLFTVSFFFFRLIMTTRSRIYWHIIHLYAHLPRPPEALFWGIFFLSIKHEGERSICADVIDAPPAWKTLHCKRCQTMGNVSLIYTPISLDDAI
jgi:hypothetical protein